MKATNKALLNALKRVKRHLLRKDSTDDACFKPHCPCEGNKASKALMKRIETVLRKAETK